MDNLVLSVEPFFVLLERLLFNNYLRKNISAKLMSASAFLKASKILVFESRFLLQKGMIASVCNNP